ncbi:MAG: aspartate-semialdehyde dehydrogenase [Candidatus Methanomethyliaceae archaeon]|nr:aspartate-semialdehyde dehydrogenase [Candidatus Methanomethyliaceae archaeon]MDW7971397.1 aspartate-semialdehyde dehydrogenase [Nitrososphaerota archaeon]
MGKIKVAVLGSTGMVGQRYVKLLESHPWFEITALSASKASVGKKYGEAAKWVIEGEMPESVRDMRIVSADINDVKKEGTELVFSALPSEVAHEIELNMAEAGYMVIADTSAHRMDYDVPLIIPEVNSDHLSAIFEQRKRRKGIIVTSPNCTTIGLAISLKPILDNFGIKRVLVSTMQALSGAGYSGVPSMAILDNLIPYIKNEEEKVVRELLKILGKYENGFIPANIKVGASCHRVCVLDGHTEAVFIETIDKATSNEIKECMKKFKGDPQHLSLPTAPINPIIVREELDRPQPRLDRLAGEPERARGMAVVVGRIREEQALDNGIKYVLLSHNTIRGAAGNAILIAELLKAKNII